MYSGIPLTFIWGTDSPVSIASSTMQRPRSSRTSHGTRFSCGERPAEMWRCFYDRNLFRNLFMWWRRGWFERQKSSSWNHFISRTRCVWKHCSCTLLTRSVLRNTLDHEVTHKHTLYYCQCFKVGHKDVVFTSKNMRVWGKHTHTHTQSSRHVAIHPVHYSTHENWFTIF